MPATSNRVSLLVVPEVTYGVTPATPAFETLRFTGESLNLNNISDVSKEIRPDRNRTEVIRMDADTGGDADFELSMASFDTILQAVLCGTFSAPVANSSTLKNGSTNRSFSIQKLIADADVGFFQTFTGVRFTGLELNMTPAEFITGKVTMMGKGQSNAATQIAGAVITPPLITPVLTGSSEVNAVLENGVATTEIISNLSMTIENNPRMIKGLGKMGPQDISLGSFDVTGNIELYFKNAVAYNRMANNTTFALSVKLQDATGDFYTFLLPKVNILSGTLVAGGLDTDMMFSGEYRAVYDTTEACTLKVTRFNAP